MNQRAAVPNDLVLVLVPLLRCSLGGTKGTSAAAPATGRECSSAQRCATVLCKRNSDTLAQIIRAFSARTCLFVCFCIAPSVLVLDSKKQKRVLTYYV
jgi:hypothetical protein